MFTNKRPYLCFLVLLVGVDSFNNYKVIKNVLDHCADKQEVTKCLKIQVLKTVDRAFRSKNLSIFDGVYLVGSRQAKSAYIGLKLNESKLQKLDSEDVDQLLKDVSSRYLESHHLEINVPRLLEEGRKHKHKGGGNGALYWALAIKGSFLAIAYQGIAVMSGLALVMGKMALLLSAILGLKKLVSSGHETTTYEIIKHPKYSEQHSYSTSYEDDSHHHRSYDINGNQFSRKHKTYI